MGYRKRKPPMNSPYLWSGSNHYTKGKFIHDGQFDPEAVSKQIGAGTMLRYMVDHHIVELGSEQRD
jgi:lysozyme family protein